MFLRPYRSNDKRTIQQLFFDTVHKVNARDYSPEQLDAWAPAEPDREAWARLDGHHCFLVECQRQVVGFASLSQEGWLEAVFVHADFQGRGIGTNLFKQLERLARKKGLPKISAEASITARSFFERLGFVALTENRKVLRGVEILQFRMEKMLPPIAKTISQT